MAAIKAGDRVRIVTREATSEDAKTGLYYAYFGGLTGTVDRVYDDDSVCVEIDLESLNDEMRERHLAMQEAERQRWISNLSDEVRNRLTPEQKQLKMSYKLLVSKKDIESYKGGKPKSEAKSEAEDSESDSSSKKGPASPGPSAHARAARGGAGGGAGKSEGSGDEPAPKRLSEADLSAAEEEFLRSRQRGT